MPAADPRPRAGSLECAVQVLWQRQGTCQSPPFGQIEIADSELWPRA